MSGPWPSAPRQERSHLIIDTPVTTLQADVVIAGSGPGGATVARELSRKGKKVIICEAGKYQKWFDYTASTMNILEAKLLPYDFRQGTREGIVR